VNLNHFFNRGRTATYICSHFTRDVWLYLTGEDLSSKLQGLLDTSDMKMQLSHFRSFVRLSVPQDPCLVFMTQMGNDPHIGVFVNDKLLHLGKRVPEFHPLELATRCFTTVRYYR
jgi:hypothetical protein